MSHIQVAIDGPASSGKSTVAKEVAKQLDLTYIDTGAMYRAITLAVLEEGLDLKDKKALVHLLQRLQLSFETVKNEQHITLNGRDVSTEIRSNKVTNFVSEVSAIKEVRENLVEKQRALAEEVSVIMDGRDIGTVVLPKADYKFFFTADAEVRAKRRLEENIARGMTDQSLDEMREAIIARDKYDSMREISPLKKADDAIEIDGTSMTVEEMAQKVIQTVRNTPSKK